MASLLIDDPRDPKFGALAYQHESPFEIDDQVWSSIHRYVLASRFEGSPLAARIREASSDEIALMISKPSTVHTVSALGVKTEKRYRYQSRPRIIDLRKVLATAIRAKLARNKEVLMLTYPALLKSKVFPAYAAILAEIRNELSINMTLANLEPKLNLTDDLPVNVALATKVREAITRYAEVIGAREGAAIVHIGMVEDAAYNIIPKKCADLEIRVRWDHIARHNPRYYQLIIDLRNEFTNTYFRDPVTDSLEEINRVSYLVAVVIRWCLMDATPKELERVLNLPASRVVTLNVDRPYRSGVAIPRPPVEVRTKQYLDLFGDDDRYAELVATAESLNEKDRLAFMANHVPSTKPEFAPEREEKEEGAIVAEILTVKKAKKAKHSKIKPESKVQPKVEAESKVDSKVQPKVEVVEDVDKQEEPGVEEPRKTEASDEGGSSDEDSFVVEDDEEDDEDDDLDDEDISEGEE